MNLTQREIEFCKEYLLCKGCKQWKEVIGKRLGIKEPTVKQHLSNIFGKFKIETQAELMYILCKRSSWKKTKWDKISIKNGLR